MTATTAELVAGAVVCVLLGALLGRRGVPRPRTWGPMPALSAVPPAYDEDAPLSGCPRVGDDVVLEGQPGQVLATIGFTAGSERWTSLRLHLGTGEEWVTVVDVGGALEVCRWSKLHQLPAAVSAGSVQHRGVTYTERERGRATYEAHGDVDLPGVGEVQYVDYESGQLRLSYENYDGEAWEASAGRVVAPGGFGRRP